MAKGLKIGRTKFVYVSEQLGDTFFRYDLLRTSLSTLTTILFVAIFLFALWLWIYVYELSLSAWSDTPMLWIGAIAGYLLLGKYLILQSGSTKIETENYSTKFLGDNQRQQIDVMKCLSPELKKALRQSYRLSSQQRRVIDGTTIAEALVQNKNLLPMFVRLAVNPNTLSHKLQNIRKLKDYKSLTNITDLLPSAYRTGFELKSSEVGLGELLVTLIEHDIAVREVFYDEGLESTMVRDVLAWIYYDEALRERTKLVNWKGLVHPTNKLDRAMTAMETPMLNQVGTDMTEQAAKGFFLPAVERQDVLDGLYDFTANHNSVVLVGEPGVGKHRLLETLAQKMVTEDAPNELLDKRLMNISIGQLISGADVSMIAKRVQRLFYEALTANNVILVIEDIHGLAGIQAGNGESVDVASILADAIERSGLTVIATSSPDEYRKSLAGSSLGEILKKVELAEPDRATSIQIVETRAHVAEAKYLVFFTYKAVARLVDICSRYIPERHLPRKATEHLDRIALEVKNSKGEHSLISDDDINNYMEQQLHLPLQQSRGLESSLLLQLEDLMRQDIIGQEHAINVVASALRRTRAGIANEKRPIAVLLFLGPTGVGKTELAKTLAKHYFNDSKNMLRIDMSEYQGTAGVSKLIGRPGHSSPIIDALRDKPFQVVLLDEFEKAELQVKNLFLQVFDDARLSDSRGKTADFTNTIIIATSNAGAELIQQATEEDLSDQELDKLISNEVLNKNFSPELLNRFDDVVIFHPLTISDVVKIAQLIIKETANRLSEKGIKLQVEDTAILELAKLGFDRKFGARPLRRAIQQHLEEPVAQILLKGQAGRRDTILVTTLSDIKVVAGEKL